MTITTTPAPATARAWLTRLRLNPAQRLVQRDIADAARLHRRVMSLVPDGLGDSPRARAGVLFRLDADGAGALVLLVQTLLDPDPGRLPAGYAQVQTREMRPMLEALGPGLPVRYRLLVNAVRRCGRNSTAGAWKRAVPLHGDEADWWWADRATAAGLDLSTLRSEPSAALTAWHPPGKPRPGSAPKASDPAGRTKAQGRGRSGVPQAEAVRVPHTAVLFEGTATVRDPEALRAALFHGIGRSKSYGCGLLSLAPGDRGE